MKKYLNMEVTMPIAVAAFLLVYISEALKLSAPMVDGMPQETFFPLIIFIIGFASALSLLYTGIKTTRASSVEVKETTKEKRNIKPLIVVIATALLVFLFTKLGYFIVAPAYLFTMMMIYDDKPQHIVKKLIFTAIITGFVYVLYAIIFEIRFPGIGG